MNITVTGGAGFIGSNLVDALLKLGHRVVVLDNFSTGKRENLEEAAASPLFSLIEGDIRNMEDCTDAIKGADCVFHEAALGSVPRSIKDPMTSTAVNILGFVNVMFAAKEAHVKRVVYASSSSVYGDDASTEKTEGHLGRQLSPYAITKYVDELFAANFKTLYGLDSIGLRYFNVFGKRQDPDGAYAAVIPVFAKSLLNHQPPTINGDGSISRDFTYIENVVQANLLAMFTDNPEALNQAYNVACGDSTTLNQLFARLRDALAAFDPAISAIAPVYGPPRKGDIPYSLASIDKARQLLGYSPAFLFEQGIQRAAEWYWRHVAGTTTLN